jgi:peptide-methionine (S)-S-oxide reductase
MFAQLGLVMPKQYNYILIQMKVSYERLLGTFWSIHNPTTKNRQGPDVGSQYRSMIAYHNQEQELVAKKSKENLERSGRFNGRTIVTEIVPATTFYKAEEYHQKYYQKTGGGGSCYYKPVYDVKS